MMKYWSVGNSDDRNNWQERREGRLSDISAD